MIDEALQWARARWHRKQLAYHRTFCGDRDSPHADGERVLADLRKFAHIDQGGIVVSPVSRMTDPYATAYRAGLRDMYLRIAGFLNVDEARIFKQPEESEREREAQSADG